MATFSLVIEYLTGYAVATDPGNREQPEWPPHPARVFMALAAAHFETDPSNTAQREALEWLATLDPPDVTIPAHTEREVLAVYVPVNDQSSGEALLRRSRQPRVFPRVHLGSEPVRQTWRIPDETPPERLNDLEAICANVTRIGHSSSLVSVRLERESSIDPTHVPDEYSLENRLRIVQPGALQRLEEAYNQSAIEEHAELEEQLGTAKGKARKPIQEKLKERFPRGTPTSQRPVFSVSHGYRTIAPPPLGVEQSQFDPNFIVLRESDDPQQTFGLESTAQVVEALRNLIMSECIEQPVPPWIGGHAPSGGKLESGLHMALVPLAFVGSNHADGHLMGLGILLPREVPYRDRAKVFSRVLFNEETNEPRTLELKMGRAGVWRIKRETSPAPKLSLQTSTYTKASDVWASVTPVLLDRMPKKDRVKEPAAWREEVAETIARSCQHAGLPDPAMVRVEKTPFFRGSLRAMPGQGGFPQLRKDRFQVHIVVQFDRRVQGPVILGAGRFRGYGLMRPWKNEERG